MEASKAADLYGLAPGHAVEIADTVQAYIQAELSGTPCWICLPPEARPASVGHFKKPVVPLLRALYGHPDSGTMWELHCDKHVKSVGFKPVGEEWQSCYFHPALRLFLVAYVGDFKIAGPKDNQDLRVGPMVLAPEGPRHRASCTNWSVPRLYT